MPGRERQGSPETGAPCRICGAPAGVAVEREGFRILKCGSCEMVFLDHEPDPEALRRFYSVDYFESGGDLRGYESYEACESFLRRNFERRIERLSRYVPGGEVLDVGCGYGYFLACLNGRYRGVGLDISEHAARTAREMLGVDVRAAALPDAEFPAGRFSLVTMWDVIEHLPDPRSTLVEAHRVLRDDGVLALTTGDVESVTARLSGRRWHLYTLPDHLWFFSERTLRRLLANAGFRVVELRREWCYYSIGYLVERLSKTVFGARGPSRGRPARSWLNRWVVPFNLFDVMYVVCRKDGNRRDAGDARSGKS